MRIWCVEDDENIRDLIEYALRGQSYEVKTFSHALPFYEALNDACPDLLLLDIMLPGEDGLSLLRRIRSDEKTKRLPVIMMTAKTEEVDIVSGLDAGADDYVTKPFGIMELLSRIRSLLRRTYPEKESKLTFLDITVNRDSYIVTVRDKEIGLTRKEYELLCYFIINQGIVLSRDRIMEVLWGEPFEGESRTIDMHIKSLRKKLGKAGKWIHTIRGVGYQLCEEKEKEV